MAKQAHDLGVRKRKAGQKPLERSKLEWSRAKRRHPGPLPSVLRNYSEWVNAGKPRRIATG